MAKIYLLVIRLKEETKTAGLNIIKKKTKKINVNSKC